MISLPLCEYAVLVNSKSCRTCWVHTTVELWQSHTKLSIRTSLMIGMSLISHTMISGWCASLHPVIGMIFTRTTRTSFRSTWYQVVKTEWDGKWSITRVLQVDGSLVWVKLIISFTDTTHNIFNIVAI